MYKEVTQIVKSNEIKDLTPDLIEAVLDNKMTDGILKEIPVVKSIIAVINLYSSYSDRIFIKKAMTVLLELSNVNLKDREKFVSDLDSKDETGSEKILMAIDKLDSNKKCKVFGKLCKLRATGKIDVQDFLRISKVIQDAYLDDLCLIKDLDEEYQFVIFEEFQYSLILLGLIYQLPPTQTKIEINHNARFSEDEQELSGGEVQIFYARTYTGTVLQKHFDDLFSED